MAKKDAKGTLITEKSSLEQLYLDTYVERLKPNQMASGLEALDNTYFNIDIIFAKQGSLRNGQVRNLKRLSNLSRITRLGIPTVMFMKSLSLVAKILRNLC